LLALVFWLYVMCVCGGRPGWFCSLVLHCSSSHG